MRPAFRTKIAISIAAMVWALAVHLVNSSFTGTIIHSTADDASYLRPAENFLHTGTWKDNFTGASAFVQRPPAMGAQHALFYCISPTAAPLLTFGLALLLHGIAVFMLMGFLFRRFGKAIASIATGIYVLLPIFWGFLSYQITEAFAVSFVTISLCLLLDNRSTVFRWLALCCIAWLFRPVLILLFVPFIVQYVNREKRRLPSGIRLAGLVLLLLAVSGWEIRKHAYMETWLDPHPIYSAHNETMFRPTHHALSKLFRIWEVRPENLHRISGSLWAGDSSFLHATAIQAYIDESGCPLSVTQLNEVFSHYRDAAISARLSFGKDGGETAQEKAFLRYCNLVYRQTISANRTQHLIRTPVRSAADLFRKSQLNLEIFQDFWRGNPVTELFRFFCLAWILTGLTATLFGVFNREFRIAAIGAVAYMIYLFWFQRMNEDRYGIVLLPVFLLGLTFVVARLKTSIAKMRKK